MQFHGLIHQFPKEIKVFIACFVVVLSIGYFTGLLFVNQTEATHPQGITENYLGNEDTADLDVMKFRKGEREMLTIIHTHILSMSLIFFLLGGLLALTTVPKRLKYFLMIEPFFSIVLTFGGIYLLWSGMLWMKYIILLSGLLMTICFVVSAFFVLRALVMRTNPSSS